MGLGRSADLWLLLRGDPSIFVCQGAQGQPETWLWVAVEDVDALYEDYKKSGAIIVEPPANYPWGSREMNFGEISGTIP